MAETNIKDVKLKIGTETQFQSKLKDLPLNTLVGTTDPIQEGELDTSIITKLNKAENALPKPTNDTTGSAGQVLKKTANGSEWGDAPSGGGKYYQHHIHGYSQEIDNNTISFDLINSNSTPLTPETIYGENNKGFTGGYIYNERDLTFFPVIGAYPKNGKLHIIYVSTNFSSQEQDCTIAAFPIGNPFDTVTEL